MTRPETFRVGEVARLAGVTVRTLHHYDTIGLLTPSGRSTKGYRLYTGADVLRLQQIRIHQQLGMSLAEIRAVLDDPAFDQRAALVEQRRKLQAQLDSAQEMLASVDAALQALQRPDPVDFPALFRGFDPAGHEQETRERWGETDAYQESTRRTSSYGEAEWTKLRDEQDQILEALAEVMAQGLDPTDPRARELADEHRLHIDRWFYPCSPEMHRNLSNLYTQDDRFAATFNAVAPGLAAYLASAIQA